MSAHPLVFYMMLFSFAIETIITFCEADATGQAYTKSGD